MQRCSSPGGPWGLGDGEVRSSRELERADHGGAVGDGDPEVVEGVAMELLAISDDEYEIRMQVGSFVTCGYRDIDMTCSTVQPTSKTFAP